MSKHRAAIKKARKASELALGSVEDYNLGKTTEGVYRIYSKTYDVAAKEMRKEGYDMFLKKLNRYQFESQMAQQFSVNRGIKESILNIVDNNKYPYTKTQGTNRLDALNRFKTSDAYKSLSAEEKEKYNLTLKDIRLGALEDFYDMIGAEYNDLKKQGYSGKEAQVLIGQHYFGSK